MFLDNTQRRSTVGRTPLDEWSARRRDLYLTTHDTHNRQISVPPVGFEPTISVGERPEAAHLLRSSGRGLCDELIARPEESYRLWCVIVCDLETSRIDTPYIYIYDISSLRVKSETSIFSIIWIMNSDTHTAQKTHFVLHPWINILSLLERSPFFHLKYLHCCPIYVISLAYPLKLRTS